VADATELPNAPVVTAAATSQPRLAELPLRLLAVIAALLVVAFVAGLVIGLIVH
jgi:hypothetical protein